MTTLIPKFQQLGTGAVNRPINEKLQNWISLTDFGADPTGVADSTAAINAAIASLTDENLTILVDGLFKITSTIVVNQKAVTFLGTGMYTAGFTYSGTGGVLLFQDGANCNVQNLSIFAGSDGRGILIDSCFRPFLQNISMRTGSLELLATTAYPSSYVGVYWGLFENIQCLTLLLNSTTVGGGINANKFIGINTVGSVAGKSGVWLKDGGDGATFNTFISCDFGYATGVGAIGARIDSTCTGNVFENCYMELNFISIKNDAYLTKFSGGLMPGGIFVSPINTTVLFSEFTMAASGYPNIYPFPTSTVIKNGGMEEWVSGAAQYWNTNNCIVTQAFGSADQAHSGEYSLKLQSNGVFAYGRQSLPLGTYLSSEARRTGFSARAWVRCLSTNLGTSSSRMQITSYNSGVPYSYKYIEFIADDQWHEYVINIVPGDINNASNSLFLEFYVNWNGSVVDNTSVIYIDDVSAYPGALVGTFDYAPQNGSGTVTLAAAATTTISNTLGSGTSIQLTPLNASAAALMAGVKSLYVTNPSGAIVLNTADGSAAAGTEQFSYIITNNAN